MNLIQRVLGVALALAIFAAPFAAARADQPRKVEPLDEGQIIQLIRLVIADEAIAQRVQKGGVEFDLDESSLARLKEAGASEVVLKAVRKARVVKAAEAPEMQLWVEKSSDAPVTFPSELSINGKRLGVFTTDVKQSLKDHLKQGWNTFTFTTKPPAVARENYNELWFKIGEVRKQGEELLMTHLWQYSNGEDWSFKDGKYFHRSGPDTREVTVSFRVYYAGLEPKRVSAGKGDYILRAEGAGPIENSDVTATLFINGTPLNTFMGPTRQYVITPYLKKGVNKIKVVSVAPTNTYRSGDTRFMVGGPLQYSPARGEYVYSVVAEFRAAEGWTRDEATGLLVNRARPGSDTLEREITITLDKDPGSSAK